MLGARVFHSPRYTKSTPAVHTDRCRTPKKSDPSGYDRTPKQAGGGGVVLQLAGVPELVTAWPPT